MASKKKSVPRTKSKVQKKRKASNKIISFVGKPIENISVDALKKEKSRVYGYRYRLKNRIKVAETKSLKQRLRSELQKTTRYLNRIKKETGKYKKPRGFKQSIYYIRGGLVIVENIYKWEASKAIDSLIESGKFDVFVIDGQRYKVTDPDSILSAVDDLETECDSLGIYHMRLTTNLPGRKITLSISRN